MTETLVTVITPTQGRLDLLLEAVASVADQRGAPLEHIVLGDACPLLEEGSARRRIEAAGTNITILNVPAATDGSTYRPARTARLRNLGIYLACGRYIAHLDDDNRYEANHLASLVDALEANADASVAHSWRRVIRADGGPHPGLYTNPWIADAGLASANFRELAGSGVFASGSDVIRDRLFGVEGQPFMLIDTSELLVRAALHRSRPFRTHYSTEETIHGLCEDRAWVTSAVADGVRFVCSERASLVYRLGGYSNVGDAEVRGSS